MAGSAGSTGLSERLTGFAYQLGWKLICRIPESWASWAFTKVADIAWRRQGPKVQVLEANLRRVLSYKNESPDVDGKELRTLSRAALRSYARYWLETFRLPVIPVERILSGMHIDAAGEDAMFANLKASKRKHMCDGYEDMKPKEGIVGSVYRWLVDGRHPAQH